jgi:hypothetical protein
MTTNCPSVKQYKFTPKSDITLHELASCLVMVVKYTVVYESELDNIAAIAGDNVRRHFSEVKGGT